MRQFKKVFFLLTAAAMLCAATACSPDQSEENPRDTGTASVGTHLKTDSATQKNPSDVFSDADGATDPVSDKTEETEQIPLSPEDIAGTWTADNGEFIHVQIGENETVTLLFGDWNSAEDPTAGTVTDLIELGTNQWNILISFDGGTSSVGYTLILEEESSASFGKSGFARQTYRFDPERQKDGN